VWRILHGLLALGIVVLGAQHIWPMGRSGTGIPMQVLGGINLALGVGVFLRDRLFRSFRLLDKPWVVVENHPEPGGARTIRIRPSGHAGFTFQPGQYAWINMGASPFHLEQHPIPMSPCRDRRDELAFTIRGLGDWSGQSVPALFPGERVWLEGP
jgi:predicted ferric reductase